MTNIYNYIVLSTLCSEKQADWEKGLEIWTTTHPYLIKCDCVFIHPAHWIKVLLLDVKCQGMIIFYITVDTSCQIREYCLQSEACNWYIVDDKQKTRMSYYGGLNIILDTVVVKMRVWCSINGSVK